DPELDAAAFDAAELATRLARGEARLFRLGLYLTVHGSGPEDLAERVTEVRNLAASLLLDTASATWRQLQGWITCLPLGFDALDMRRVFDTDALAACFPFTSPDLPIGAGDAGMGVLFGLNLASSGVVVWDRWAQDNYNAVILARSGAGKSYFAKLDLLHNLYLGVEAFAIDPEDEYVALAGAVGGTVIRPGAPGVRINPLDLNPGDGDDALYRRTQFMQTFVAVVVAGDGAASGVSLPSEEAAALDDAVLAAYRAKGARKYGAALTVVTQDAADVLSTDTGRAVVSNAATQILLRQAPQAIDRVAEAFDLTDGERAFLLSAGRGDALLACGTARVAFHSLASDVEAQVIQTGPAAAATR